MFKKMIIVILFICGINTQILALEWQDTYENSSIKSAHWNDAISYCEQLSLDGGNWRLPSIDELLSLTDKNQFNPAIIDDAFENTVPSYYWSSTQSSVQHSAWFVHFETGYHDWHNKDNIHNVRCVRGDTTNHLDSFSRDASLEVVYDSHSDLSWQDMLYTQAEADAYASDTQTGKVTYWDGAKEYCESLEIAGTYDWRLPSILELSSIIDYSRYSPASISVFKHTPLSMFWSSSDYINDTSFAWRIYFLHGDSYWIDKTSSNYVRCVRSGQINTVSSSSSQSSSSSTASSSSSFQSSSLAESSSVASTSSSSSLSSSSGVSSSNASSNSNSSNEASSSLSSSSSSFQNSSSSESFSSSYSLSSQSSHSSTSNNEDNFIVNHLDDGSIEIALIIGDERTTIKVYLPDARYTIDEQGNLILHVSHQNTTCNESYLRVQINIADNGESVSLMQTLNCNGILQNEQKTLTFGDLFAIGSSIIIRENTLGKLFIEITTPLTSPLQF